MRTEPRTASRLPRALLALPPLLLAVLLAPLWAASQEQAASAAELEPSRSAARTSRQLVASAGRFHYADLEVDDALSDRLLERYLRVLDPQRVFLLASDVAGFEPLRTRLDDALINGELAPAFEVFERFQERRLARLDALLEAVAGDLEGMRFDVDEWIELDRSETPWAVTSAELDELWRKLLKNEVLELRMADRSVEESREVLQRRYEQQRHRAGQVRSTDVVALFLNAFTSLLDPHTQYFAPRDAENFDISMSLSLEGIGALIGSEDGYCRIEQIVPGGPAERSGELNATDRILGVAQGDDGAMVDVRGWRNDEVVDLIRGEKGTVVRLQIVPGSQPEGSPPREVRLVREQIRLEDQAAQSRVIELERPDRAWRLGVIELPAFYMDFAAYRDKDPDYRSATRDVARLVDELVAEGVDGLVIDLRGNGGGSLMEARELAGLFLGPGPVVQIRDAAGRVQVLSNDTPARYEGPLAVLVDRISASASEIFAGAVQDRGRGLVLGARTFGKGTVQEILPLAEGQLKLTHSKFYRASGASTQSRGVLPDLAFPPTYDAEVIGESALDDALPWDSIEAVVPAPDNGLVETLAGLRSRHRARVAADADFRRAADLLVFREERRQETRVSLDEEARQRRLDEIEAERDAIEARWREARGEPAPEEADEPDEEELRQATTARMLNPHRATADAYQREACEVLADLVGTGATLPEAPWIRAPGGERGGN